MSKLRTPLIILLIIGTLILLKFLLFPAAKKESGNTLGAAKSKISEIRLSATIIKLQKLDNTLSSTGSLIANEEVQVQPEVSGKITGLYIKEGTPVTKGQLLLKINDQDLIANLTKLQSNLSLANQNALRQKKLLAIHAISQQEYDTAQNVVESTRADIEFTKATILKTRLYAPFNGRIGLRYVSMGTYINPGTKIASLAQIDHLKLDFSVPGQYAGVIHTGDQVFFTVQGFTHKYEAQITAMEPKIDMATRTFHLRALFKNNKEPALLPGAFADVQLVLKATNNALLVPTQAIVPVLKGQTVFLYKSGKALQVPVEIGIRTDAQIQITAGVHAGDTLITTGLLSTRPGDAVLLDKIN